MPASSLPGRERQRRLELVLVLDDQHVGEVDARGLDRDHHFAGAGLRRGQILDDERLRRAVLLAEHSFHRIDCHMPTLTTDDGVKLYYEEAGSGTPIVFVHEFARRPPQLGAAAAPFLAPLPLHRLQRARLSAFRRARGLRALLAGARARRHPRRARRARTSQRAHIVGLSMGAFATLHFGMDLRPRARCRSPSPAAATARTRRSTSSSRQDRGANAETHPEARAWRISPRPTAIGPTRVQLQNKDPRGFAEYLRQFSEHSALGAMNTLLGVQCRRPSFYDLTAEIARIDVPTLIMTGRRGGALPRGQPADQARDPAAALAVLPKSGHGINLEEPALFNRCWRFFSPGRGGTLGPARSSRGGAFHLRPTGKP